jgi:hypothetical protein
MVFAALVLLKRNPLWQNNSFEAVRPTRDKVCLVTCRSYEEYVTAELAAQLDFNPSVVLHVIKPHTTKKR